MCYDVCVQDTAGAINVDILLHIVQPQQRTCMVKPFIQNAVDMQLMVKKPQGLQGDVGVRGRYMCC